MKILIVDDHPESRHALGRLLEESHRVLMTASADHGCQVLRRILDIQVLMTRWLPDEDQMALQVCKLARALPRDRYLYIIMLAAPEHRQQLAQALDSGADAFLLTPIEVTELKAQLIVAQRIADLEERLADQTQQLLLTQRQMLDLEVEKKRIYRDVLRAVSHGKLHLVEPTEIPCGERLVWQAAVAETTQLSSVRQLIRRVASDVGMSLDRAEYLVIAAGEALTNALRYAIQPACAVWLDSWRILVRISDKGRGMDLMQVPHYVLRPGASSTVSLGAGFEIILRLTDEVWLATGPQGTVVQMSVWQESPTDGAPSFDMPSQEVDSQSTEASNTR